jgi:hypothetical protein
MPYQLLIIVALCTALFGVASIRRAATGNWELWITAAPKGEAPLWVREKWVGLTLPLARHSTRPRPFMTSGVLSGPRTLWAWLMAFFGRRFEHKSGYAVSAKLAIELLESRHPEAADWWKENAPHVLRGNRSFLFDADCGSVRRRS